MSSIDRCVTIILYHQRSVLLSRFSLYKKSVIRMFPENFITSSTKALQSGSILKTERLDGIKPKPVSHNSMVQKMVLSTTNFFRHIPPILIWIFQKSCEGNYANS